MKVIHFGGLKGLVFGIILLVIVLLILFLALNLLIVLIPIVVFLGITAWVFRIFKKKKNKQYIDVEFKKKL